MKTKIEISGMRPVDETEDIHLDIDDSLLEKADCFVQPKADGKLALARFEFDASGKPFDLEVWLDPETRKWTSGTSLSGVKLSPDQLGRFFQTQFFADFRRRLNCEWSGDDVLKSVNKAEIDLGCAEVANEDGEFRKGNVDKEKSREKNAAGRQERTNSGRKIVTFSQFGLNRKEEKRYYCWPEQGKEFKWSQWADWKKIVPLARMRLHHNQYRYGISISPSLDTSGNRGWRGYNLDIEPKLQWLTTIETDQLISLTPI